LRASVKDKNLTTIALTPYLTCGDIPATELAMKHAHRLGASLVRVGVPWYNRNENYNHMFAQAITYLEVVEDLAKKYNVKALVETHHMTIAASASLAHRLVQRFNPNYVGVLFDPGNMVYEGFENYRMGLELLGEHLAHVHIKNAGWFQSEGDRDKLWSARAMPMDQGMVDWKQVLHDLKSVGYTGWYGVEDFSGLHSSKEMLVFYTKWFKALLEEVEG
jgi:sugar phosphate isomerase/epimerase